MGGVCSAFQSCRQQDWGCRRRSTRACGPCEHLSLDAEVSLVSPQSTLPFLELAPAPLRSGPPPHTNSHRGLIAESFCWIAVVVWVVFALLFSLSNNQIGGAMMKTVRDAVKHAPTAVELWQTFRWCPTSVCYHQLCRPRSQLAVYTVLCVDARLYFQQNISSVSQAPYIPTELWHIALSFLRTYELGSE